MKIKIDEVVGETVQVDFNNHEDNFCPVNHTSFRVWGKLEYEDDDKNAFYVRVKEDYNGTSGATFPRRQVRECEIMPSGAIHITL